MALAEFGGRDSAPFTRRVVVTTGARLAYAAPLVAASFKLRTLDAAAISADACNRSAGIVITLGGRDKCCRCGTQGDQLCAGATAEFVASLDAVVCKKLGNVLPGCPAICEGITLVSL